MANSTTLYTLPDGRLAVDVTEAKTLAATDSGVVQVVKTDAILVTLPATAVGLLFTILNGQTYPSGGAPGAVIDKSVLVAVSPNAADKIMGMQVTAADDKDFLNTKATSRYGDELSLLGDGSLGWYVTRVKGTWAKEA